MNKNTEAKCAGSALTVGFHGANPPLIWRFDLERNHSFTLALQGEEGEYELGVTGPRGDFVPVAHFAARENAEEALAKVEKVLARRAGLPLTVKAFMLVGGLAIAIVIGVAIFALTVDHHAQAALGTPLAGAAPQNLPEGVPLPANQVLRPPSP